MKNKEFEIDEFTKKSTGIVFEEKVGIIIVGSDETKEAVKKVIQGIAMGGHYFTDTTLTEFHESEILLAEKCFPEMLPPSIQEEHKSGRESRRERRKIERQLKRDK